MDIQPIDNMNNLQDDQASRPRDHSARSANTAPQPFESNLNQEEAPAYRDNAGGDIQMNDQPRLTPASAAALSQSRWATEEDQAPRRNRPPVLPRINRRRRDGRAGNNAPNTAALSTSANWNLEARGYLTYDSRRAMAIRNENMNAAQNSAISLGTNTIRATTTGPQSLMDVLDHMSSMAPLIVQPTDTARVSFQIDHRRQHIRSANEPLSQAAHVRRHIALRAAQRRVQPDLQPQAQQLVPRHPTVLPREHNAREQHPPPQLQPRLLVCANCDIVGHALRDCVTHWTPAGDIPGCYRCNRMNHTIDTCRIQPPIDDATRYNLEVVNRVGRPPLRSTRGWNQLAIAMNHSIPGPISRMKMISLPPTHFNRWDYNISAQKQKNKLVLDPATRDLDHIHVLPDQGYVPERHPNNMRGSNQTDNQPENVYRATPAQGHVTDDHDADDDMEQDIMMMFEEE
ncbi:hypothetical protein GL218_04931 [Daldinia childiae]|uniref:uncharacterized protein n=1 Tax=Daldinia childiae TaxID=326645 RepID=UPI00144826F1|nr:uncharacterized protein GL218_04931 [Daldinia childiae]KAF3059407.1 hypothetical protein GL218_04931 [Daldinia childiae]